MNGLAGMNRTEPGMVVSVESSADGGEREKRGKAALKNSSGCRVEV